MSYFSGALGGPVKYGHGNLIRGERWLALRRCFMTFLLDKDDRSVHSPHQTHTYAVVVGKGEAERLLEKSSLALQLSVTQHCL